MNMKGWYYSMDVIVEIERALVGIMVGLIGGNSSVKETIRFGCAWMTSFCNANEIIACRRAWYPDVAKLDAISSKFS